MLFLAGGSNDDLTALCSCEYFDFEDGVWTDTQYKLPYGLSNASSCGSKDGSFAIITGGWKHSVLDGNITALRTNDIITFTPESGFNILNTISMKGGRTYHASVGIKNCYNSTSQIARKYLYN